MRHAPDTQAARPTLGFSRTLLFSLAFLAPAELGSNTPVFWAINGGVAAVLLLCALRVERHQADSAVAGTCVALLLGGTLALIAWLVVQGVAHLGSLAHPIWALVDTAGRSGAISLAPDLTLTAATNFATLAAVMLSSTALAGHPDESSPDPARAPDRDRSRCGLRPGAGPARQQLDPLDERSGRTQDISQAPSSIAITRRRSSASESSSRLRCCCRLMPRPTLRRGVATSCGLPGSSAGLFSSSP